MMKLTQIGIEIRAFVAILALGSGAGLLRADATQPPPPFVNPDAPAAPMVNPVDAATATAPEATPTADTSRDFNADQASASSVAAPSISDDQQIKNAMDMAYEMYHAEDYDSVCKATAAIMERFPKRNLYWVRYLNALSYEHQDLYRQALDQYQKVMEDAKHSTYSNASSFRIGLCQMKSGQTEEAIYTLRDIIENNPRSEYRLQAYLHLGNLYRQTRDWRSAARIYKDMIRYYHDTSWAWTSMLYLGETHAHQGDNNGAIHVYQALIRDEAAPITLKAQAKLRIGDLYINDQRWLEALQTYKEALRDYNKVPGVASSCEDKIEIATEGRKWGRVPYRQVKTGIRVTEAPEDENYRMKQEQEKVPYQP